VEDLRADSGFEFHGQLCVCKGTSQLRLHIHAHSAGCRWFGSDDIVALDTATLDIIGKTRLIEENIPTTMEIHTREGHPFQWLHGPLKDPYKVVEYGEQLGLGTRDYELVDVLPLEFPERSSARYIAA
jgi:hypothetical protein